MVVTGRTRRGNELVLIIRQPDGTLAHIPVWMTRECAAGLVIGETVRLSLAGLRTLRLELDRCLGSLQEAPCLEGQHTQMITLIIQQRRTINIQNEQKGTVTQVFSEVRQIKTDTIGISHQIKKMLKEIMV